MPVSLVERAGFGVAVDETAVNDGSAVLSTTATKVALPDVTLNGGFLGFIKVKIVNPNATAVIAWDCVTRGAAAPTITANFASPVTASHVLPGQTEYITIPSGCDLYIVASAAASSWSTTAQLMR